MAIKFTPFLFLFLTAVLLLSSQPSWSQGVQVWLDVNNNLQINTTNLNDTVIVAEKAGRIHVLTQAAGAGPRLNAFAANRVQVMYIRTFGGDDFVFQISSKPANILTYEGNDKVLGGMNYEFVDLGEDVDIAYTRKGGDFVDGEEHRDFIILGPGDDAAFGGAGKDLILGQDGDDDLILGLEGNDLLFGGSGAEDIRGGDDDDMLFGGAGTDELSGFDGNDILCGGTENDKLSGGLGNDGLWGEPGADHHDGGVGNDKLFGNAAKGDTFANGAVVMGDFDCGEEGGDEPGDGYPPPIEAIFLEDELLAVSDGTGHLYVSGTAGDDIIVVQAVDAGVMVSHSIADVEEKLFELTSMPDVVIQGGSGDDQIEVIGSLSRVIVDGEEGNDTLSLAKASYGSLMVVDEAGDDVVHLGAGLAFVATEPGTDHISGGSGIRYVANSGLESNGDDSLVLLDHLDWPAVEVDEEEGLFKTLIPVILLLLVVIMVVLLRLKLKRGA